METGPYSIDEKDAANYILPDPLQKDSGERINSASEWMNHGRKRILKLLMEYEYGEILPRPDKLEFHVLSRKMDALDGLAVRKEVRITAAMSNGKAFSFVILVYVPVKHKGQVPVFAGLNFDGNHTTTNEDDVIKTGCIYSGKLVEEKRGFQHSRWIPETIVSRGYATVTCCYHDIFPNRVDGAMDSAFRLFCDDDKLNSLGEKYSIIGVWAWGLSRIMDYIESDPDLDACRVAVHGHSRLGKTALWAGAIDTRFAMVISNCSGCGGGALHKRKYGENLSQHFQAHIDDGVPCWFVNKLEQYIWHEERLPIDQHELLAMVAPRPLAIGTATLDYVADQKGEFLACQAASDVYRLFGSEGLPTMAMPPENQRISGDISFHYNTGPHDQKPTDWEHYLELADRFLK